MRSRRRLWVAISVGAIVLTASAVTYAYWQATSANAQAAAIAVCDFLGLEASQLRVAEVSVPIGRGQGLQVSYPRADGTSESVIIVLDPKQEYVTSATWLNRYAVSAAGPLVSLEQAQGIAFAFAAEHCPFWGEGMELELADALPRDKPTTYHFSWVRRDAQSQLRVTVLVPKDSGEVFAYLCRHDTDLKPTKITADEALQIARDRVDKQKATSQSLALQQGSITFQEPHFVPASDHSPSGGPIWEVSYLVEYAGVTAGYAVYVDALTGDVVYPVTR